MIKSMTGFGRAKLDDGTRNIVVEIKTLNSKFLDMSIRLPKSFNEKELDIRNSISEKLERGKTTVNIEYTRLNNPETSILINETLFKNYFEKLQLLAKDVGAENDEIFKLALQYPDVQVQRQNDEDLEEEWKGLNQVILEAIKKCDDFRIKEGEGLKNNLNEYVNIIGEQLTQIDSLDPDRLNELKERIKKSLDELKIKEDIDQNRFEQELIYYIEKLDISEEKVRLKSHLAHFLEAMNSPTSNGKKLNFISQEMGREINTIGSKANYAPIQRLVVNMKDELEKIKEQLQNIV